MNIIDSSPAELTADQIRIAQLFGSMDDDTQKFVLVVLEGFAEKYPRHTVPLLRLVKGGSA